MNRKFVLLLIVVMTFLFIIVISIFGSIPVSSTSVKTTGVEIVTRDEEYENDGKKIIIKDLSIEGKNKKNIRVTLEKGISHVTYKLVWRLLPSHATETSCKLIIDESKGIKLGGLVVEDKTQNVFSREITFSNNVKTFYVIVKNIDSGIESRIDFTVEVDNEDIIPPIILPE